MAPGAAIKFKHNENGENKVWSHEHIKIGRKKNNENETPKQIQILCTRNDWPCWQGVAVQTTKAQSLVSTGGGVPPVKKLKILRDPD